MKTVTDFDPSFEGIIQLGSCYGNMLGFTPDKFEEGSYLWLNRGAIYLSMMMTKGKGNFRALVAEILRRGYAVKIPTPLGRMQQILLKNAATYVHTKEYDPNCEEWGDVWVAYPKGKKVKMLAACDCGRIEHGRHHMNCPAGAP